MVRVQAAQDQLEVGDRHGTWRRSAGCPLRVLAPEGGTALVGKDTRLSGYMFEAALEAGLSSAGVDVVLCGPLPTPGVAYLTRALRLDAGVVISASHNPYPDNGIKFFSAHGKKLPDAVEAASRTLDDPKPARIYALIQRIINDRFQQGELDECPLTLRDLAKIREAFAQILMGAFHRRVDYPRKD